MYETRLLFAQFVCALVLATLTWFAVSHALYWRFWWFDIPMHLLGGLWAGFAATWTMARRGEGPSLFMNLALALFVALAWEAFEYSEGLIEPKYTSYGIDTIKDIFMALVGATLAFFLVRSLWRRTHGAE